MTAQGIDQRCIDRDFPHLYEMAQQYDFTERLGGTNCDLLEEADKALRELWMARGAKEEAMWWQSIVRDAVYGLRHQPEISREQIAEALVAALKEGMPRV